MKRRAKVVWLLCSGLLLFNPVSPESEQFVLKAAFNHRFSQPLDMAVYPEKINNETFYSVVEKRGKIFLVTKKNSVQSKLKIQLLDLSKKICSSGYEEGLLGLAFDPDFKNTRRAYVYYSTCSPKQTHLGRIVFSRSDNNGVPDFTFKEEVILTIQQPYGNHNGGCIKFGKDGFLYIGTGDGGSAGDPHNNAQNNGTLLGKMLRIDVRSQKGYSIPSDNPFVNTAGARPEIYAYGLRNPWRFSIDMANGQVIAGDVGQNKYEEITLVKKGQNHGWRLMEGMHCYNPETGCNKDELVLPLYEYNHDQGQSVIGGYVYHGSEHKSLQERYVFGDYMSGKIWSIDLKNPQAGTRRLLDSGFFISSFAVDEYGEIYVLSIDKGIIYLLSN